MVQKVMFGTKGRLKGGRECCAYYMSRRLKTVMTMNETGQSAETVRTRLGVPRRGCKENEKSVF